MIPVNTAFGWANAMERRLAHVSNPGTAAEREGSISRKEKAIAIAAGSSANAAKFEYRGPATKNPHGNAEKAINTSAEHNNMRLFDLNTNDR